MSQPGPSDSEFLPPSTPPSQPTPPQLAPYAPYAVSHAAAAVGATESAPATAGDAPAAGTSPAEGTSSPARSARRRFITVPVVAALLLGAVLGGATGAGVSAWITAAGSGSGASSPGTIIVNDPDDATAVTAVAAVALPSTVTIAATSSQAAGTGSGIVLSADGYVLTNNHVVTLDGQTGDPALEVTTAEGRRYAAEVVGLDPVVDLAVIKLQDAEGLQPIGFSDSGVLNVGDDVVAIGAPLGLANSVTDGVVSALHRGILVQSSAAPEDVAPGTDSEDEAPFRFWNDQEQSQGSSSSASIALSVIQTDAAVNPGNSGGALLDAEGALVGVIVAIASAGSSSTSQAGSIGVGFAIPSELAERVAGELIRDGQATHGQLGAQVRSASSTDSDVLGAYLAEIVAGSAAASAGLQPGDIVIAIDGVPVTDATDLTAQIRAHAAGAGITLSVVRGGARQEIDVTLGAYE